MCSAVLSPDQAPGHPGLGSRGGTFGVQEGAPQQQQQEIGADALKGLQQLLAGAQPVLEHHR